MLVYGGKTPNATMERGKSTKAPYRLAKLIHGCAQHTNTHTNDETLLLLVLHEQRKVAWTMETIADYVRGQERGREREILDDGVIMPNAVNSKLSPITTSRMEFRWHGRELVEVVTVHVDNGNCSNTLTKTCMLDWNIGITKAEMVKCICGHYDIATLHLVHYILSFRRDEVLRIPFEFVENRRRKKIIIIVKSILALCLLRVLLLCALFTILVFVIFCLLLSLSRPISYATYYNFNSNFPRFFPPCRFRFRCNMRKYRTLFHKKWS